MKICALEECNNPARIKFCSNTCKDKYHNRHNPRGKFAHLAAKKNDDVIDDDFDFYDETTHPFSGEALGQD